MIKCPAVKKQKQKPKQTKPKQTRAIALAGVKAEAWPSDAACLIVHLRQSSDSWRQLPGRYGCGRRHARIKKGKKKKKKGGGGGEPLPCTWRLTFPGL